MSLENTVVVVIGRNAVHGFEIVGTKPGMTRAFVAVAIAFDEHLNARQDIILLSRNRIVCAGVCGGCRSNPKCMMGLKELRP